MVTYAAVMLYMQRLAAKLEGASCA
jgi:hypothetical protein